VVEGAAPKGDDVGVEGAVNHVGVDGSTEVESQV